MDSAILKRKDRGEEEEDQLEGMEDIPEEKNEVEKVENDEQNEDSKTEQKNAEQNGGQTDPQNENIEIDDIDGETPENNNESEEPVPKKQKLSEPVQLGYKTFHSEMECFQYFNHIIKDFPEYIYVNEYEHKALLDLLQKGHHDPQSKIGCGVKGFMISQPEQQKKSGLCFNVVQENDEIVNFSYLKCLNGLFPGFRAPQSALGGGKGGYGRGGRQGRDGRGGRHGGWGRGRGRGRDRDNDREGGRGWGGGGRQGGRRGRE